MPYLSKEIEALTKRKHNLPRPQKGEGNSLVKKGYSCGIFQDYWQVDIKRTEDTSSAISR